jgi:hypothetical protein
VVFRLCSNASTYRLLPHCLFPTKLFGPVATSKSLYYVCVHSPPQSHSHNILIMGIHILFLFLAIAVHYEMVPYVGGHFLGGGMGGPHLERVPNVVPDPVVQTTAAPYVKDPSHIRSVFPETWLWTNSTTGYWFSDNAHVNFFFIFHVFVYLNVTPHFRCCFRLMCLSLWWYAYRRWYHAHYNCMSLYVYIFLIAFDL